MSNAHRFEEAMNLVDDVEAAEEFRRSGLRLPSSPPEVPVPAPPRRTSRWLLASICVAIVVVAGILLHGVLPHEATVRSLRRDLSNLPTIR